MGTKITFNNITASFQSATAMNAIFDLIEGEFDKCLYTDGTAPNQMTADLDLNSNDILNAGNVAATDITIGGVSLATQVAAAATSATNAATSASAASASAVAAAASAVSAAASFDSFDDIYLGAKAVAPTLDNDGDALQTGAMYYDTVTNDMQVYDGGWGSISVPTTLLSLSDTPSAYTGDGGKFLKVNVGETGIEFVAGSGVEPSDGDKGDIVVSGSGLTWTIEDSVAVSTWNLTTPTFTTSYIFDGVTVTGLTGLDVNVVTGTAGTANDLVIWNADGDVVDGPTPPAGTIVGTTDTQALTNKTIDGSLNTITNVSSSLTRGTPAATTSGTSHDFGSIPAGVDQIIFMASGVSTNGTSDFLLQLGDAGGIEATGYLSSVFNGSTTNATTGFIVARNSAGSSGLYDMHITLSRLDGNLWVASGNSGVSGDPQNMYGSKTLSAELTQVRLTTVTGTNTFDAGSINIMYI